MIPPDYEKGIRRAFLQVLVLCLCAVVPPLFSLTGIFRPEDEPLGQWFQRSGSVMTAFAVFAHFKAGGIATMIAGGTFAETWEAYHKYNRFQALAAWLSLVLEPMPTTVATITGPQADLNLGIATYVNGSLMNPVQIDTSTAATDTIAYVVGWRAGGLVAVGCLDDAPPQRQPPNSSAPGHVPYLSTSIFFFPPPLDASPRSH
jgi:hypothetical protein